MKEIFYDECTVWKKTGFCVGRKLWVSEREIAVDYKGEAIKQPKYKYEEIVCFKNACNYNEKKAICIGYNPALAIKEIDATNKRLITKLEKEGYSGYVLYNLYPEVTATKDVVDMEDAENKNSHIFLRKKIFESNINDIILFFGRTAQITKEIVKLLREMIGKKNVMLTCFNSEFIHPGAVGTFELQDFKEEYIRNRQIQPIRIQEV